MNMNRRQFTGSLGAIMLSAVSGNLLSSCMANSEATVDGVSMYLINVTKARNFSHSTWHNRQHVFVQIESGEFTGLGQKLWQIKTTLILILQNGEVIWMK